MADLDRIKRNVSKMVGMNAPESDIDAYIAEEGVTVDDVRAHRPVSVASEATLQETAGEEPTSFREAQRQAASEDRGALAASTTAGAQGWSWGASDEIMAGVFTPLEMAIGAITGEDADKGVMDRARDAYSRGLELQRAQIETARENHPVASVAGEVAGGMATAGAGMGAAKTTLGRMAVGAGEGVAAGGVTGFMSGEGLEDRLAKAETGAMVGAGVGAAFPAAAAVVGAAARGGRAFAEPFSEAGRDRIAARRIEEAATDPEALRRSLDEGAEELVPGSDPTTFQVTGDMGIGGMERAAQTRDPAAFNQRRADQNAARVDALGKVQPEGAPEAVSTALRQRLQQIDDETQAALDAATGQAEAGRRGVDERTGADLATATRDAQDRAGALGAGMTPDAAGDTMRGAIETARAKAKAQERALWSAVDPDGTLALGTQNVRQQAQDTLREMPKSAKPPSGEEAAILDVVAGYKETMPFGELTALQSRLKGEMRAERFANGESPAYRRLSQLNTSIQSDLETAVSGKVAQEADAVARGELDVNETLMARFAAKRDGWFAERAAVARGTDGGGDSSGYSAAGSTSVRGVPGAGGQTRGRPGGVEGDPRLAGATEPLEPNFDAEALGRLNEARAVTKGRVETFDNKALGPIRRRPGTTSPYDMPAAAVPGQIFKSGVKGFDAVETYRRAVGNDPEAMGAIRDYAVDRLKRVAGRPDGTLDPSKLTTWRRMHSDALRAFPDLDQQLQSAAGASEAVAAAERNRTVAMRDAARPADAEVQATRARSQALADAQSGTVGRLAGVEDPQDVVRLVGGVFSAQDSAQRMLKLRGAIGKDEGARQGLRKAVVEHMSSKFVGNTEAATSGIGAMKSDGFQTFVRQNKAALRTAGFGEDEIGTMEKIAADLQRANRSIASVKLPGQSNTAQDALAVAADDKPMTILGKVVAEMSMAKAAGVVGGGTGAGFIAGGGGLAGGAALAGAGVVVQVIAKMREAGLTKVNDIVADALLNPERARLLLSSATGKGERDTMGQLAKSYARTATVAGTLESGTDAPADLARPPAAAPMAAVPVPADRERATSPRLTPDDRASPIPSDLVDDGKAIMDGGPSKAPTPLGSKGKEKDGRGGRVTTTETRERWGPFAKRTGTMGIPRSEMPQIMAEHRGAMINFLAARGIKHSEETVPADSLKPTQREFSPAKVEKAKDFTGGNRAILVSSDWQILDGHHQWLAKREDGGDVRVIRLDAPIRELLEVAREFPSATLEATSDRPKSKLKALQERAQAKAEEKLAKAA